MTNRLLKLLAMKGLKGGGGGGGATLGTKSITANGTYNASDDNFDGYSQVEVDVQSSLTRTTLWTNTDSISSYSYKFAEQTVTLSDDIDNYEYIEVRYKTAYRGSNWYSTRMTVEEFKDCIVPPNTGEYHKAFIFGMYMYTALYTRCLQYLSDTSIKITDNNRGTDYNTMTIPLNIYGLK